MGGYIFFGAATHAGSLQSPASGAVSWQAKLQSVVALSTLEAEYIACSDATREALWIQRFQIEISHHLISGRPPTACTIPIGCDNQGAIQLIKTGITKQKTKHIAVKYHHSHDEQSQGNVKFEYIPTSANVADILTKPLPTPRHQYLTGLLGLHRVDLGTTTSERGPRGYAHEEEGVC